MVKRIRFRTLRARCWACSSDPGKAPFAACASPLLGGLVAFCCEDCRSRRAVPVPYAKWFLRKVSESGAKDVSVALFDVDGASSGMPVHVAVGCGYVPFLAWAVPRPPLVGAEDAAPSDVGFHPGMAAAAATVAYGDAS